MELSIAKICIIVTVRHFEVDECDIISKMATWAYIKFLLKY